MDTDCKCRHDVKSGNWEGFKEEFQKQGNVSEWTYARLKEAHNVASEDVGRLSIAQDVMRKSTDFLRRIITPADGMGGVTLSFVCPHCSSDTSCNDAPRVSHRQTA